MIDKRIIFENSEGGISIVVPAPDSGLTLQEVIERAVPYGASYKIVDVSQIPSDRTFRNAWEFQE
jgi:hypothetical protein